jgi:hypothetical protein
MSGGMSERNRVVYVTADQSDWLAIDVPFGLITPPTVELHRPLVGTVQFFYADSYRLAVPDAALVQTGRMRDERSDVPG